MNRREAIRHIAGGVVVGVFPAVAFADMGALDEHGRPWRCHVDDQPWGSSIEALYLDGREVDLDRWGAFNFDRREGWLDCCDLVNFQGRFGYSDDLPGYRGGFPIVRMHGELTVRWGDGKLPEIS